MYRREIGSLHTLGCRYLQLDDASLAYLNDPTQRLHVDAIGGRGEDQHQTYIRVLNDALRNRPADMTICIHLCRGNFRSAWIASGGYDHVAIALFNELDVDGYFLEFDDQRLRLAVELLLDFAQGEQARGAGSGHHQARRLCKPRMIFWRRVEQEVLRWAPLKSVSDVRNEDSPRDLRGA